jgi:hypothetical protein
MCDESIERALVLSYALTTIINIAFNMGVEVVELGEGSKILDEFDLEFLTL